MTIFISSSITSNTTNMAKVAAEAVPALQSQIDALTSDPNGAPGVVFAAVNKKGEVVFEHASGKVGAGRPEPMTMNNVFWIASCTKMITGIACMQLVEQGKLSLDDSDQVEKLAPVSLSNEENGRLANVAVG